MTFAQRFVALLLDGIGTLMIAIGALMLLVSLPVTLPLTALGWCGRKLRLDLPMTRPDGSSK